MDESNNQQPQINTQQFNQQPYSPQPQVSEHKANVLLAIISFLIPLVGLILYLTQKSEKTKAAKTYGKCALASVIIGIIFSIISTFATGALFKEAVDDTLGDNYSYSDDANTSDEVNASEDDVKDSVLGDYECVVKGAEKCTDWQGKEAVTIIYDFTNNSNKAISFDVALSTQAYQDGIGLETTWLNSDDTDIWDVEIKPGITKEVRKAYILRDSTTDVEIEVSELFSFTDDKIVTTVKLG